jgi:hypothetical protein
MVGTGVAEGGGSGTWDDWASAIDRISDWKSMGVGVGTGVGNRITIGVAVGAGVMVGSGKSEGPQAARSSRKPAPRNIFRNNFKL